MRRVIFLFVSMIVAICSFAKTADSKTIALHARHANDGALRSVLPVRAILDGNVIMIDFFESPEHVIVKIKDTDGVELILNEYASPEFIQLQLNQSINNYIIDIVFDDIYLSGNFEKE